ncbi:MAG: Sec-independent protein translocase, TatC subunit [Myxococcales bacterium]|nr:Sec-independent protein translocase, TatC subunit [Myxococcales bacterium]
MASPARADDDTSEPVETELEESRMPFLSHLKELRDRVRNAAIAFTLAFGLCFYFAQEIYDWLEVPVYEAWRTHPKLGEFKMSFSSLTEPFWVNMSVALWAGIFVASPFIFYQLWKFIAPGLYKRERRIGVSFAVFSALFFVSGALFCYHFVLGRIYEFLLGYATQESEHLRAPVLMLQHYLDLTRDMMLAFGAVFELPLLIYFLSLIGMVTHRGLWKFNRWFTVIAFIIGAILTPSPDVVSQLMMAGPMIALYNLSILISWYVTAKRERKEAALAASGAPRPKRVVDEDDDADDE